MKIGNIRIFLLLEKKILLLLSPFERSSERKPAGDLLTRLISSTSLIRNGPQRSCIFFTLLLFPHVYEMSLEIHFGVKVHKTSDRIERFGKGPVKLFRQSFENLRKKID